LEDNTHKSGLLWMYLF